MDVPQPMHKLQTAIEAAMDELQVKHLIPLQKEAFVCSAACCDKHRDMQQLQQCTVVCQQRVQAAHQVIYGNLEQFQERFKRCLMRCEDMARESLPAAPSDKHIQAAQAKQLSCMDACAGEYQAKVPKLKSDAAHGLSKLGK